MNIDSNGTTIIKRAGLFMTDAFLRYREVAKPFSTHADLVAMAARHGRGVDRANIGTTLTDPNIDFATLARGIGVYGEGPIVDPKDLAGAIARAVEVVKRGEPAVVDVVTDPR
jgi:thiamine pyrophosphate-dependent acetolactate synthase large subunit-like protein